MTDYTPDPNRRAYVHNAISEGLAKANDMVPLSVRVAATRAALAEVDAWHAAGEQPAVSTPPADQNLRDRIRRAVCEAEGFGWDTDMLEPDEYGEVADAVLAVLPAPADRAAVLREAAIDLEAWEPESSERWTEAERNRYEDGIDAAADHLRRMADEAQQSCTSAPCPHPGDCRHGCRAAADELTRLGQDMQAGKEFDYPRDPDAELILNSLPPEAQRKIRAQLADEAQQAGEGGALKRAHVALAEQAGRDQAALARVCALHDNLAASSELTSPDEPITRGAAARRIAAALDGAAN